MHPHGLSMKFSNKLTYLLIMILLSVAWGEKLVYSAGFRLFDAGEAVFTSQSKILNDESVLLITSTIKTNSFLSRFYNVHDVIKIWSNKDDFTLLL